MILLLKLLVFPLVLLDFQRLIVESGYITWEVIEVSLVFGDNVTIRCTYHNRLSCTDHIFWTWTTGTDNEIIMTNGTLSEKYKYRQKYSEKKSSCTQYSDLQISNFSEKEYRKIYKCGIANINSTESSFVEYSKEEITFENISYEYAPALKMVSTVLNLKNQQMSLSLKFDKIYPVPECQATCADSNVTNALEVQIKKIGLFYNVIFTYTTSNMSVASFEDLCIRCNGQRSLWTSLHPFCKEKSVTVLTTTHNLVDISHVEGVYLAAIVFVGIFSTLYPVSVMVIIIRSYFASNDQFYKLKHLLSKIETISHVCKGSCLMVGVLSLGVLKIKVTPDLPIQLEHGMNVFSMIAMVCPTICWIPISSMDIIEEWKKKQKKWCTIRLMSLWLIFPLFFVIVVFYGITNATYPVKKSNRLYFNVFFIWMPIWEMIMLSIFKISICNGVSAIETMHRTRDERFHRNTGSSGRIDNAFNSQNNEEIRKRSDNIDTASNSQNNVEMRECLIASNRQSDEEMTTYA